MVFTAASFSRAGLNGESLAPGYQPPATPKRQSITHIALSVRFHARPCADPARSTAGPGPPIARVPTRERKVEGIRP